MGELGDGSHISGIQAQLELDLGDDSDCGVHAETELDVQNGLYTCGVHATTELDMSFDASGVHATIEQDLFSCLGDCSEESKFTIGTV